MTSTALNDVPNVSGIYAIVNTANGKQYVGSALDMRRRLKKHFRELRTGQHWNGHLSSAFVKNGERLFRVDVIAFVEPGSLLAAEQWYIDRTLAADNRYGYNLSATAGRASHSAETRARIAAAGRGRRLSEAQRAALRAYQQTPEARERLRRMQEARRGVRHSAEARAKISAAQIGRPGRKLTPEQIDALQAARRAKPITEKTRAKMSAAKKGKPGRKLQPHEIDRLREISIARRGKPNGRTMSKETVAKMLATRRANAARKESERA